MKKIASPIWLALLGGLSLTEVHALEPGSMPAGAARGLAEAPLYFEANQGQADGPARFIARGADSTLLISTTEAVLGIQQAGQTRTVRLTLVGANPTAEVSGVQELPGRASYFLGDSPAQWQAGVPLFARVRLAQVYPGMDVVYYADHSARLEYDFILQPGADPALISLRITGADKVRLDAGGNLVLKIGREEIREHRPVMYQMVKGVRREIKGGYRLNKTTAGFWVGDYDRSLPLVIDPVLSFSTYLGGKFGDAGWDIAVDATGSVYVCGDTFSTNLRTNVSSGAFKTNYAGTQGSKQYGDAFVAKYRSTNGVLTLDYLTYLGGKGQESARGIAADAEGSAYVTGFTDSSNFPITTNAAFTKISGRNNTAQGTYRVDAFVTKLGPAGTNLIYSTYLGGGERDAAYAIAVNAGNAFVTGFTESTNFPVRTNFLAGATKVVQNKYGGVRDAFVTELGVEGTNLVYSTYLGGTNQDSAYGIAVDSTGAAYLTGYTLSTNFPTFPLHNSWLNSQTNRTFSYDSFFTKVSPSGEALDYSTYLGGEGSDVGLRIALDNASSAYLTGYSYSTNFPVTTNVAGVRPHTNPNTNNLPDIFVTKFSPAGGTYLTNYSVKFGGRGVDQALGITVDPASGKAIIAGLTSSSTNLFNTNLTAFVDWRNATNKLKGATNNAFVAVLNADASAFEFATLIGGSKNDQACGVAFDAVQQIAYVVGNTVSTNFPLVNPAQVRPGGAQNTNDVFLASISLASLFTPASLAKKSGLPQAPPTPTLYITYASGNVTLIWPVTEMTFILESTPGLSPADWQSVQVAPVSSQGWLSVQLPAHEQSACFRLKEAALSIAPSSRKK